MKNGRFSNDLVTSNVDLNVILAKNDCTNDKKVTKKKKKKTLWYFQTVGFKVGNLDLLHDPHVGGIYKRNYSGVEEPRPGYIINACMKLLYCFDNAEIVKDLILSKSAGSRTESN